MGPLDKVLAAADLTEPTALGKVTSEDEVHAHLMKQCPWYRNISEGKNCGHDPAEHCKPGSGKVKLTPRTAEASTVPEPIGKPNGPGLWHVKGMELPAYVQHLAHHLIGKYGESRGIAMAKGIVAKWAKGVNPGGRHPTRTHPDVRAAAAKAIGQWEDKRARAHAQSREHDRGKVKATVALAQPSGPMPGVTQHPAMAPSPPLPPDAKLPSPAELRALAKQVPECVKPELSQSIRNHLEAAAVKLSKDDMLEALHVLRAAQAGVFSAHKADLGTGMPAVYTANASRVDVQSQAHKAMIASRDRELVWRKLEHGVALAIDKIRRKYYHGSSGGPTQIAMFGSDAESALDRVLRLTGR